MSDTYQSFSDIPKQDDVELYTIQSLEQISNLKANGFFTGSGDHILDDSFRDAYQWLIRKMIYKYNINLPNEITSTTGLVNPYPVWFWYASQGQAKRKPDLRLSGYSERGDTMALVTFKKKWQDILVSDFGLWHSVLNRWLISHTDLYRDLQCILDKNKPYKFYSELDNKYQQMIRQSWDVIFDMHFCDPDYTEPFAHKTLQGTTWLVRQSEVTNVKLFKAR